MATIFYQWKQYIRWINYKLFLEKQFKKLVKETKELKNQINSFESEKKTLLAIFKHINNPNKSLKVYLVGKEISKKKPIDWIIDKIFFLRFDGYFFNLNKGNDMKIYKIKNLRFLKDIKKKELYNIHEKEGTHKGKPFYLSKYPLAITLNIDNYGKLFYDVESYYNYVNTAVKSKITNMHENFDLMTFLKKNIIIIIFFIIILLLIFTPEGQKTLQDILSKVKS